MRSSRVIDRWGRWAAGRGPLLRDRLASFAVGRLVRELGRGPSAAVLAELVRVAAHGPEAVAARAFDALRSSCDVPGSVGAVIRACLGVDGDRLWSAVSVPLLFRGSPSRLDRYLRSDVDTAADGGGERRSVAHILFSLARRRRGRAEARRFLAATDLPMIVDRLVDAFKPAPGGGRHYLPDAATTAIALANPHVIPTAGTVGLAVAKGRADLVDLTSAYTADDLLFGCASKHPATAEACRRQLRALPPGPGLERVCAWAMMEPGEATAAVIDAGYLPKHPLDRAALLFVCRRWDEYDTFDPDGGLLYQAYAARRHVNVEYRISHIATQNGRPDPAVRHRTESRSAIGAPTVSDHRPSSGPSSTYGSDFGGHYGGFHT
jgi:hypothetical protein